MDFVALDFETANEKRVSACAIGLTIVRDGRVVENVYHLIRPRELRFSPWNTQVHGITQWQVKNSPSIIELWPTLLPLLESQLIVAHNASFDMSVLRQTLSASAISIPRISYLCTMKLSRQVWPDLGSYSLGFLAEKHGLKLDHHHAGSDAHAAAQLVLLAARRLNIVCPRLLAKSRNVTVGELYASAEKVRQPIAT